MRHTVAAMSRDEATPPPPRDARLRLDKWLWAARLFKTRSLAKAAIDAGHVHYNGERARASREVVIGASLRLRQGHDELELVVHGLSDTRTAAPLARTLYAETDASRERRERAAAERRAANTGTIDSDARPTKQQRRLIHRFKRSWQ